MEATCFTWSAPLSFAGLRPRHTSDSIKGSAFAQPLAVLWAIFTCRQVRRGEASVGKPEGRGGQRRQQGAAFTPEAMDSYLPRVEATCRAYLNRWARQDCIDVQEEVRQEFT